MEKLSLHRFREIKSEIIELVDLTNQFASNPNWNIGFYSKDDIDVEEKRKRLRILEKKIDLAREELKSHDLSEIGFDEYKGFIDIGFNFQGTGANLDFSMIDFSRRERMLKPPVRVKGCNIKNVDLSAPYFYFYDDDSFDEEFMQAHPEYFLDKDVTDEKVRERYYQRILTLQDLEDWNLDNDSYIKNLINFYDGNDSDGYDDLNLRRVAEIVGIKNLLHIGANLIKIFENEIYDELIYYSNLDRTSSEQEIEDVVFAVIKDRIEKLFPLDNNDEHDARKKLLEDLKTIHYSHLLENIFRFASVELEDVIETPELFKEYKNNIGYILEKVEVRASMLYNNIFNFLSKSNDKIGVISFFAENAEIVKYSQKNGINIDLNQDLNNEQLVEYLKAQIEKGIFSGKIGFDDKVPTFFKEKYPEFFLDDNAPLELKKYFYHNVTNFQLLKNHPEWKEYLQAVNLRLAFPSEYRQLFDTSFDTATILKLVTRNPETVEKMVQNHKVDALETWYKATGGKFVPHHVVMLKFPEGEIDSFFRNSKKWSQLMKIEGYNLNDDGKAAILKAAYTMGVFQDNDEGFNKTIQLFTDVPEELSKEEHDKVVSLFSGDLNTKEKKEEMESLFEKAYTLNKQGKYVLRIDKQKDKNSVRMVRKILEEAQISRILTPEKAHQIFDSFTMEYNPDFDRFFNENIEEILSNTEVTKSIATIQRQFKDIVRINAGRRLTLDVAQDYIKSIVYTNIEVGNESLAEQAQIVGYSQEDFELIQSLFNEGEVRDFSSIPRIQGRINGYSYEMLRCDDPLALTIGTLTDCCQEIHGAGQTSMEHSVVSPDGRVFCVKDSEGRLVAQSWFWRNQYTGCFDNIEIPKRIFKLYEKQHPDIGGKGLADDVLEVYKKAAQDLMQEDARVYKELLDNGTITQEQYDALLLGKVTIGLGYNDIAEAITTNKTIHKETDIVGVKGTDRLPHPYTDALRQYTIAERDGIVKSQYENLYVHQDDIPEYDGTNMSSTVLLTMKRMEQETGRDNLAYLSERKDESNPTKSQMLINSIARKYGLDPDSTKVMATARIALIYSKDKDNKVKIGDLLSAPIKEELTKEQKQKAKAHIINQFKRALKQIGIQGSEVDLSSLSKEKRKTLESVMQKIENDERGER